MPDRYTETIACQLLRSGDRPTRSVGSDETARRLNESDMNQPPSDDENDVDSEENEINERLDRVIDFLASYLP
jgi:hypothetical protein